MKTLCIPPEVIRDSLTPERCIDLMDHAMRAVSAGKAELPLRWGMKLPNGQGVLGIMPGYLGEPECFGIKLVSLFPGNPADGLSSHLGLMMLYEAKHGQPLAIMNADLITALRTAAASALATRELARADASTLAVLGTGEQARSHLPAMLAVRDFSRIAIWGRRPEQAERLADEIRSQTSIEVAARSTVRDAVADADVICTVTSAAEPVLFGEWIPKGTHVNLVGSSVPQAREIDSNAVACSRFFVDYRKSTMAQAGELLRAIEEGIVTEDHIAGEIGEVLESKVAGRLSDREITIYKSLGIAAQDLVAAHFVFEQARSHGTGTFVEF